MGHARRAATAVALAAAAAITLAGCGSGGGGGGDPKAGDTSSASAGSSAKSGSGSGGSTPSATQTPTKVLAQIKGESGMQITVDSAVRDTGGFVTVQGEVTNNGTDPFTADLWVGPETALAHSGASVAGAVLVDEAGKKRYYVLRDTDGRCLCTMGLVDIEPKETRPFFAQFPSPPAATTDVEFELPTMPPAKITISQG